MSTLINILRLGHILTVVFMAWPLYALIAVNERGRLGSPLGDRADRYMENIIKGQTIRCYVFQLTAAVTGVASVYFRRMGLGSVITNWVLLAKSLLVGALLLLLSYVHFNLQPKIDALFEQAGGELASGEIAVQIGTLRATKKKLASVCLFLVMTIVMLGLQVYARFNPLLTLAFLALIGIFVWRAYRGPIRYGWI